jgi:signal transduction histidine kinase
MALTYSGIMDYGQGSKQYQPAAYGEAPSVRMLFHDLRKLIQSVVGPTDTLEIALEEGDGELAKKSLGRIRNSITCVEEMLWNFSAPHPTASSKDLSCDIGQVVEDVVGSLTPTLRKQGIEIQRNVKTPVHASISKADFHRIILNLVVNATEAIDDERGSSSIKVAAESVCEDWVEITVQDTGCGIRHEDLPAIFEAGHTTKGDRGGSGLGLAVVKQVVEASHGTVCAWSQPGQGTRFTVRLPNGQPQYCSSGAAVVTVN